MIETNSVKTMIFIVFAKCKISVKKKKSIISLISLQKGNPEKMFRNRVLTSVSQLSSLIPIVRNENQGQ